MKIQSIKSPGGIEAWLVEEHMVPALTIEFAFEGGSSQDPAEKDGVSSFLAFLLKQGAGEMTELEFQERVADLALRINYRVEKDVFVGCIQTLMENCHKAAQLLKLALTSPHLNADAVEFTRKRLLTAISSTARDPHRVANTTWDAVAFAGHPYARPILGTAAAVGKITAADLDEYRRRVFAKDTLKVVAVGAISPGELGLLLDEAFGDLLEKSRLLPVEMITPATGGRQTVVDMDVPQSFVAFGLPAIPPDDPDYRSAFVLGHIIGGGRLTSRLMEELRTKRGLVHSVSTSLVPMRHASVFRGSIATRNVMVGSSLAIIRAQLQQIAAGEIAEHELDDAKRSLTGSYLLRLGDNFTTASQLMRAWLRGLDAERSAERGDMLAALTLDDLKRVGARLFADDDLIVAIVGKPVLQHAMVD